MEINQGHCNFSHKNFNLLIEENNYLKQQLEEAEEKINWFLEQIKLGKQRMFGRKSEAHVGVQLELAQIFDDEEPMPEPLQEALETITYTRKKSTGRKIDTSKLPRERVVHDIDEKHCKHCGTELQKIGEDVSEQLEYIPATIKVIEHICPKYACRNCETIIEASKPKTPLPKSMATASLITEVIIKKYEHHLPWYRQSKIFAKEGIDIPANTIGNWFMQAGEVLEPLRKIFHEQLDSTNVLQVDETPVKVLDENIRGYMWCYHSCVPENRFLLFEYNSSRSGQVVNNSLKNYKGILQSDGYSGYNSILNKQEVIGLGCWAHCRRKFVDVIKITNQTGKAEEVVGLIGKLYQIERKAREEQLDFAARKKLRQQQAPPILKELQDCFKESTAPPKSVLGKAIAYALNRWSYLIRYIDHGEAEIDNNLVENQIRPFALGKKNWLFAGNEKAAGTAAFFYSLIQSCRLNSIDPRKYLIYVLNQAGAMRRREVDPQTLLPQFIDKIFLA